MNSSYQYHEYVEREIAKTIEIYGFLSISDLTNPPTFSRHVLLPSNNEGNEQYPAILSIHNFLFQKTKQHLKILCWRK